MSLIFRFIFLTAVRDWLYISLLIIIGCVFGFSNLLGYTALTEQLEMQTIYFSSVSRVVSICGIILFICFHIRRSFENKEIEFILSKPISRIKFILSYWLSFNFVSLLLVFAILLIMFIFCAANKVGLFFWAISLILELLLVSTFAIVSSLILQSAITSTLASFSFYLISRLMGFFVYSIDMPYGVDQAKSVTGFLEMILKLISSVFPRLDLFAKSEWLIYGVSNYSDIWIILIQSAIYIPLVLFLASYDFKRKQF